MLLGLALSGVYCSQDVREASVLLWLIGFVGRGLFISVGHGFGLLDVRVEGVKNDELGVLLYVAEDFQDGDGGQDECSA